MILRQCLGSLATPRLNTTHKVRQRFTVGRTPSSCPDCGQECGPRDIHPKTPPHQQSTSIAIRCLPARNLTSITRPVRSPFSFQNHGAGPSTRQAICPTCSSSMPRNVRRHLLIFSLFTCFALRNIRYYDTFLRNLVLHSQISLLCLEKSDANL